MHFSVYLFIFLALLGFTSGSKEYNITPITTSSGLYYEKIGEVLLSNSNWEFITSVDYAGYLLFYQYIQNQADKLYDFCRQYNTQSCIDGYKNINIDMGKIADTDEILANFLGFEKKTRVKRFGVKALAYVAPYVLEPLGESAVKLLFGDGVNKKEVNKYNNEMLQLRKNQQYISNQIPERRTMFELDSEKKENQIKLLQRTQNGIENELKVLRNTVSENFEEHERKIKDLNEILSETKRELRQQEEKQQQLVNDVEHIKNGVKNINKDIESLVEEINTNRNAINDTRIEMTMNSIIVDFKFLLSRFKSKQKLLLDVIQNANRGFLDPYIITPLHLIEMLRFVQPSLPEDSRLPFHPNYENTKNLYNIIKPTILFHNYTILFILQIPLVHTKTFEIFKMTSLPMQVGNDKFVYVSPQKEYLIVNDRLSLWMEYVLTSHIDFRMFCQNLGGSKYICDKIQQLNGPASSLDCEAQLFLNTKPSSANCNTRLLKLTKPVFIKLLQSGAWIFVAPEPKSLTVTCSSGHRQNVNITGVGILNLSKDCKAKTSEFGLEYIPGSKPVRVSSSYSPPLTLTEYIDSSRLDDFDTTGFINPKQVILPFDLLDLDIVSEGINVLNTTTNSTNYTVAIFVTLIIILVTVLIVRKMICICCKFVEERREIEHPEYFYTRALNRVEPKFP